MMFRRSLIENAGFDQSLGVGTDTNFALETFMLGGVVFTDEVLAEVRQHDDKVASDPGELAVRKLTGLKAFAPYVTRSVDIARVSGPAGQSSHRSGGESNQARPRSRRVAHLSRQLRRARLAAAQAQRLGAHGHDAPGRSLQVAGATPLPLIAPWRSAGESTPRRNKHCSRDVMAAACNRKDAR